MIRGIVQSYYAALHTVYITKQIYKAHANAIPPRILVLARNKRADDIRETEIPQITGNFPS